MNLTIEEFLEVAMNVRMGYVERGHLDHYSLQLYDATVVDLANELLERAEGAESPAS